MRTTRKSILALTAGAASIALVLTGCQPPAEDTGDVGADEPADEPADGAADEEITLTVATFNEFGYEDLITEYMELNPGITVEHIKAATSQEARDKLNTSLAAGTGASDVEAVETDWWPELLQYAANFEDLSSDEVEGRWLDWKTEAATTADGQLVGYGTDIGPEGICYRSDLFAAAGLPTDRAEVATLLEGDWAHYFEVGETFVAASDAAWFDSAGATYSTMVNQMAEPYETSDGTPKDLADNADIQAAYEQVLEASVDKDLSAHLGQWGDDWFAAFQNGAFATMACPGWMLGVIEGSAAGVEGWDIADVFPGGGGNWGGSYLTVPQGSEHPEEAIALAAWLTAPEQQLKAFAAKGTFPSQLEALESEELLSSVNPFFNDAPVGEILANRAAAVEVQPFKGPNYFSIHTTVTDAISRVDVDQTDDAASSWEKALSDYQNLGL
ncbi:MAG: transporter substrate-binding protein [Actinotalea sp.]|nr:transporter substrate-binding protein [Actinotalea sp.]